MYCPKCEKWRAKYRCPIKSDKYHCPECGQEVIASLKLITCVEAVEMPNDVIDWCVDHEYSTHYNNSIAQVYNSDNPFANWLKKNGYKFKAKFSKEDYGEFDEIGIIAT